MTGPYANLFRRTIQSINFDALACRANELRANELRANGLRANGLRANGLRAKDSSVRNPEAPAPPLCTINPDIFAFGSFNIVFEIDFGDGQFWIARIPRLSSDNERSKHETTKTDNGMNAEVLAMQYVRRHTTIPVPEVYGFSSIVDPAVGCRYILMEALPGKPVDDRLSEIPEEYRANTFAQLADIKMQLSTLTFSKIGSLKSNPGVGEDSEDVYVGPFTSTPGCLYNFQCGPFDSAVEFFHESRRLDYEKALQQSRDASDDSLCFFIWLKLLLVSSIVNFNHGPFRLHHPDIGANNLLLDNDFNITGLIDWSGTVIVPVESFCIMPLEFRPYQRDFPQYNLIWNCLEEAERKIEEDTPLTRYMKTLASRVMIPFDLDLRGPVIMKQHSMAIIRQLFGMGVGYDDMLTSYRNSKLLPKPERKGKSNGEGRGRAQE
jgi:hypothetical protein